jgi:hypothetical protein
MPTSCADSAADLEHGQWCLYAVSKDLSGTLTLLEAEREVCEATRCVTLQTVHHIKSEIVAHPPCDSREAAVLDGVFLVRDLVQLFIGGDGNQRAVHAGSFRWNGAGALVTGTLSGVTNVGTHREPAFKGCQRCDDRGYMEGRLCGRIVRSRSPALVGCQVMGAYRFRFDANASGGEGPMRGTFEGAILCPCRKPACLDFQVFPPGPHPNPWALSGASFLVKDFTGTAKPTADVKSMGAFIGLDGGHRLEITPPPGLSAVSLTLVTFAGAASAEARFGGVVVDSKTMTVPQATPETLLLSASNIDSVVVTSPSNEVLLLEICFLT